MNLLYNRFLAFHAGLLGLSRTSKQLLAVTVDAGSSMLALWFAFALRFDTFFPQLPQGGGWIIYLAAPLLAIPVFWAGGLYKEVFRYSGFMVLASLLKSTGIYALLFIIVVLLLPQGTVPKSVGILQPILLLLLAGGSRSMVRLWIHSAAPSLSLTVDEAANGNREKVLIYGAGEAGVQIAGAIHHNTHYAITGFLDDNPDLQGSTINGIRVYKPTDAFALTRKLAVTRILLALPSIGRTRRSEIVRSLQNLCVRISILPGIEALADGHVSMADFKEVEIEDLLGRDPVPPVPELFAHCITGKTVMVTGAGGSIGSELCRQIVALRPAKLLMLEQSEYHLYLLNHELQARHLAVPVIPVLGDVTDTRHMQELCRTRRPDTIYHAAAYKHVPMVEQNPAEGLRNNVYGTLSMVQAAFDHGVRHFVLVSTDKAVRPTNIMGASKRICELVLQAFANGHALGKTCFSMVRFGNVLGSSGSVIPLFRQQLHSGGPLTVTHEDVTRYFMTIPEATQLVIQAGAMSCGGDVYLLDMGEPVKIIDLARRMVELSGLSVRDAGNPEGDIEIEVTGLRPGEKLYEELLIADNPEPTAHPRIFKANEHYLPWPKLELALDQLREAIETNDYAEMMRLVRRMVPEYAPAVDTPEPVPVRKVVPQIEPAVAFHQGKGENGNGSAVGSIRHSLVQPVGEGASERTLICIGHQCYSFTPDLTVLIVEDDNVTGIMLKHALRGEHVDIYCAANGLEALDLVEKHPELGIVLMDLVMPKMDGFEATERIRKLRPNLPIIIQTSYSDDENREKAFKAGCSGFLAKPVAIDQLLELMQTLLSR